eukprot:TRINITY_DN25881_c0_g1_i1.p1 TRINITY_DN25881_c0_g1~~TRINITY_DN25881_c0_g1_i1.p1  ORF type:complete len:294 (-),score=68.60 TRINITY_DN25881_c0_g1_i1:82-963(-)
MRARWALGALSLLLTWSALLAFAVLGVVEHRRSSEVEDLRLRNAELREVLDRVAANVADLRAAPAADAAAAPKAVAQEEAARLRRPLPPTPQATSSGSSSAVALPSSLPAPLAEPLVLSRQDVPALRGAAVVVAPTPPVPALPSPAALTAAAAEASAGDPRRLANLYTVGASGGCRPIDVYWYNSADLSSTSCVAGTACPFCFLLFNAQASGAGSTFQMQNCGSTKWGSKTLTNQAAEFLIVNVDTTNSINVTDNGAGNVKVLAAGKAVWAVCFKYSTVLTNQMAVNSLYFTD